MRDLILSDFDTSSESDDSLSGPEESPRIMKCKVTILMIILLFFALLIVSMILCGNKKREGFHVCNYVNAVCNIMKHFEL